MRMKICDCIYTISVIFNQQNLKNAIFWDVALCTYCMNRHFGGTYRPHLQNRKMEAIYTSETWVHTRSTEHHISENGILIVTAVKTSNKIRFKSLMFSFIRAAFATRICNSLRISVLDKYYLYRSDHRRGLDW
jgi:hypothetical protein